MSLRRSARVSALAGAQKIVTTTTATTATTTSRSIVARASSKRKDPLRTASTTAGTTNASKAAPTSQEATARHEQDPTTPPPKRRRTKAVQEPAAASLATATPSAARLMAAPYSSGAIDGATTPPPPPPLADRPAEPHVTNAPLVSPETSRRVAYADELAVASSSSSSFLLPSKSPAQAHVPKPSTTTGKLLEEAYAHLIKVDPKFRVLIDKYPCRLFSPEALAEEIDPFRSLVSGIMAQQVRNAST